MLGITGLFKMMGMRTAVAFILENSAVCGVCVTLTLVKSLNMALALAKRQVTSYQEFVIFVYYKLTISFYPAI